MPRHCHINKMLTMFATRTYVLRSIGCGMMRVHTCLKAGRAITECCTANSAISAKSIDDCGSERIRCERIDRLRHSEVSDKAGHVRIDGRKQRVADDAVTKISSTVSRDLPPLFGREPLDSLSRRSLRISQKRQKTRQGLSGNSARARLRCSPSQFVVQASRPHCAALCSREGRTTMARKTQHPPTPRAPGCFMVFNPGGESVLLD